MVRVDQWPKELSRFLDERRKMPFQWGVNDCMAFVAASVKAITGKDYFPDFSDYDSEETAQAMLEKNGGPQGIINKCLGNISHKNALMAKRGDVVLIKAPNYIGGIVDDTGTRIALVSPLGLVRYPLSRAVRIWPI